MAGNHTHVIPALEVDPVVNESFEAAEITRPDGRDQRRGPILDEGRAAGA